MRTKAPNWESSPCIHILGNTEVYKSMEAYGKETWKGRLEAGCGGLDGILGNLGKPPNIINAQNAEKLCKWSDSLDRGSKGGIL